MVYSSQNKLNSGFTLIQISIMLTIASLVFVSTLPSQQATLNANFGSTNKLVDVFAALRQYQTANGKLPCPADATLATGANNYGVAAANAGTSTNCYGGTPSANYRDVANNVAIGGVPWRTLGLSSGYALDGYSRAITYAVDTNATVCQTTVSLPGKITITDKGNTFSSTVALVSHGKDGHGAWLPLAGNSGSPAARLNAGSTDADQLTNAHVDSSFLPTAVFNNFIKKDATATFDDTVLYSSNNWNIKTLPQSMQSLLKIGTPDNGTYTTGILSFTVTYPNTVTVTGIPRLVLSGITGAIGVSNTGYATYVSGSGTNQLTFNYTIVGTDSAPSGLKLASYIDLNSGTISACPLTFIAPDLSQIIITTSTQYLYVADSANHRVLKLDLSGNFVLGIGAGYLGAGGAVGSTGTSTQKFNVPAGVNVDNAGNIWVKDQYNERIMKFNSAGAWQMTLGGSASQACSGTYATATTCNYLPGSSPTHTNCCKPNAATCTCTAGTGNGRFDFYRDQMAFDATGNLWTTDHNNGRLQEFDSGSGAFIALYNNNGSQFASALNIDANNNIWAFAANGAGVGGLGKCSTANGTCTEYGTIVHGTGPGTFQDNCDYPLDQIAFDLSNNVWITNNGGGTVLKFSPVDGTYQSTLPVTLPHQSDPGDCSIGDYGVSGIAFDASGYMWVADNFSHNIYKINPSDGTILLTLGTGSAGSSTSPVQFNEPAGIFIK